MTPDPFLQVKSPGDRSPVRLYPVRGMLIVITQKAE